MTEEKITITGKQVNDIIDAVTKKVKESGCDNKKCSKNNTNAGVAGGLYFFGFLGALVYFLQQADSLINGIIGLLKAIVWPAYLVYNLLSFLKI